MNTFYQKRCDVLMFWYRFLYQGRELSYTSILDRSISARRQALYASQGLDIERWMELVNERKVLRREINNIRGEYEGRYENESGEKKKDRDADNNIDRATKEDSNK